jgi:hypothetical protein
MYTVGANVTSIVTKLCRILIHLTGRVSSKVCDDKLSGWCGSSSSSSVLCMCYWQNMLPGCGCAKHSIAGENGYISIHFVAKSADTVTTCENDPAIGAHTTTQLRCCEVAIFHGCVIVTACNMVVVPRTSDNVYVPPYHYTGYCFCGGHAYIHIYINRCIHLYHTHTHTPREYVHSTNKYGEPIPMWMAHAIREEVQTLGDRKE